MGEEAYRELVRQIAKIETQYPLRELNPLKAGGVADFFTIANDTVELATAVKAALDTGVPYLVIGQGDGALFSDGGFPGLVIQNRSSAFAVATDRSQVVADSGLPLSRFITWLASRSLGGLTHLYGEPGTLGGAIYANLSDGFQPILSSVRYLTMLMPPARLDRQATIARYKVDWLTRPEGRTRLQAMKAGKEVGESQPVILTALFQLTSVRPDEIQLRLQEQVRRRPPSVGMGPVFSSLPDADIESLLVGAGAATLKSGNVFPDRRRPNFLRARGSVRSADIRALIEAMQERVASVYGVAPVCRYEFLGVW